MAHFSNSTEGFLLDEQCMRCKFGQGPCPIAWVQHEYNYKACNDELAREILDNLVDQEKGCMLFTEFKRELYDDPNQLDLF